MSKNRLLLGATGLVGRHLLDQIEAGNLPLRVLARRPRASADPVVGSRTDWHVLSDLSQATPEHFAGIDCVICALGTTQKIAGSRARFAAIDRDLVLQLARLAHAAGARHWLQVSAQGAHAGSAIFYNRIKGETENALRDAGFARLDIVQPSLLLGDREDARPAEALGQKVMPLLNPLLRGRWRKYRAVSGATVAATLLQLSHESTKGTFVHALTP